MNTTTRSFDSGAASLAALALVVLDHLMLAIQRSGFHRTGDPEAAAEALFAVKECIEEGGDYLLENGIPFNSSSVREAVLTLAEAIRLDIQTNTDVASEIDPHLYGPGGRYEVGTDPVGVTFDPEANDVADLTPEEVEAMFRQMFGDDVS